MGNTKNEMTFAEVPVDVISKHETTVETANETDLPDAVIKTGQMEIQIHNSLSPMLLKSIMELSMFAELGGVTKIILLIIETIVPIGINQVFIYFAGHHINTIL